MINTAFPFLCFIYLFIFVFIFVCFCFLFFVIFFIQSSVKLEEMGPIFQTFCMFMCVSKLQSEQGFISLHLINLQPIKEYSIFRQHITKVHFEWANSTKTGHSQMIMSTNIFSKGAKILKLKVKKKKNPKSYIWLAEIT